MAINWTHAKARVDVIVPLVTMIGLFAAGFYTLFEYRAQQNEKRIATAMSYVARFSTPPLSEHRASLANAWATRRERIRAVLINKDGLSDAEVNRTYSEVVVEMVNDAALGPAIREELLFFEQVSQCVELELCDNMVTRSMLEGHSREFLDQYSPYMCALRKQWNDKTTGAALQRFVRAGAGKDICAP